MDLLVGQPVGQRFGLRVAERCEPGVGGSFDGALIDAEGQGVAYEQQLHGDRVLASRPVPGLFVTEHGDPSGPLVVFVHGSLDRSSAFARVGRHLADAHVVRYDRRGYGRSLAAGPAPAFEAQVDDLAGVVAGRPAVLVGHSLGGVIALAFAQRSPSVVRSVVAYEAPMSWLPWWPTGSAGAAAVGGEGSAEDAAERFMRRMVGDDRWERLPDRTREQRRAEGPALVAELRSIRPPAAPPYSCEAITVPVLAAHGTESAPHHKEAARVLADAVPAGELATVEGAGHGIHLTHPAELAGLTRRALSWLLRDRGSDRTTGP